MTDIDIDFAERRRAVDSLDAIPAVLRDRRSHPSGVYFQDIPIDPLDDMALWDYEEAAERGYFKVDFLSNSVYQGVRDEAHLMRLLTIEPPWAALDDPEVVSQLAHLNGHFAVVQAIRPHSIEDLAICIALIRPGKRHLIGQPRAEIDGEIWRPTVEYHYKRSHAIAYAASIIVQLNLLDERVHLPTDPTD
jgi:hypothetical protein